MRRILKTLLLLLALAPPLAALDLWLYPEAAEPYTVYAGILAPSVSFATPEGAPQFGFAIQPVEVYGDFVLPGGLPFSLGVFAQMPSPNLKHFGLRAAYHIDINDAKTDLFFMYVFDFGFVRNRLLRAYNDMPTDIRWYDFRAGVRRLIGKYAALAIESGYKLFEIRFGLAVKIN